MKRGIKNILWREFKHHIPFAATASAIAIVLVLISSLYFTIGNTEGLFHWLHIIHVFFSAIATSAIFFKYNQGFVRGLFVGVLGAILIGSLSDIIFPYLGALIFGMEAHFHLPVLEIPLIIFGSAIIGTWVGSITKKGLISHSMHVFLSVFASLFYFIGFTGISSALDWLIAFLIVFVTVWIPCCFSDIIFPLLFGDGKAKCECHHRH